MSILVTGGTGLIGSNIARMLIKQDRKVVVYARSLCVRCACSDSTRRLSKEEGYSE